MLRQQDAAEHLLLGDHVPDERAAVAPRAHRAGALLVDGARVVREAGVAEVQTALARERGTHAAGARGQHAVEHVDAHADGADERGGVAHTHEVARLGVRICSETSGSSDSNMVSWSSPTE